MYIQYVIKHACERAVSWFFSVETIHKSYLLHEKRTVIVIPEGRMPLTCHLMRLTLRARCRSERVIYFNHEKNRKILHNVQYTVEITPRSNRVSTKRAMRKHWMLNEERFGQRNRRSIKRNWLEFEEQEDDESEKKSKVIFHRERKGPNDPRYELLFAPCNLHRITIRLREYRPLVYVQRSPRESSN